VTAFWSSQLLSRSSSWNGWLGPVVLIGGVALAILLLALGNVPARVGAVIAGSGLVVALAGPAAYGVQTASTGHSGSIVTAGPTVAGSRGGPGGFGGPGGRGFGGGAPGGQGATPNGQQNRAGSFGGAGGLLQGSTAGSELVALLQADASSYRWAAAAVGSNNAAGYQLASGEPVMSIGGFNGSDPWPTLAAFQQYVAAGEIHYFIGGGGFGSNGGSNASSEIAQWVSENFEAQTVGGTTVYDLTQ
jgi:hypothetical protein